MIVVTEMRTTETFFPDLISRIVGPVLCKVLTSRSFSDQGRNAGSNVVQKVSQEGLSRVAGMGRRRSRPPVSVTTDRSPEKESETASSGVSPNLVVMAKQPDGENGWT